MCKLNNAQKVNGMTPICSSGLRREYPVNIGICPLFIERNREKKLATPDKVVVIIFTHYKSYGSTENNRFQSPSPPPKPNAQFPRSPSSGPTFSGARLLRPARLSSGQIRNAATGSEGRGPRQRGRLLFWFFPAFVLQGPGGFRASGLGRSDSPKTRSQGAAQTQGPNHGLCRPHANAGALAQERCPGASDSRKVRPHRSSPHAGTSFARGEKKTSLAVEPSAPRVGPRELVEHYEKVREQALGRNSGGGSRWGQAVLVNRGVAAWMQAAGPWLAPLIGASPTGPAAPSTVPPMVHRDLVQLLSELVLAAAEKANVP